MTMMKRFNISMSCVTLAVLVLSLGAFAQDHGISSPSDPRTSGHSSEADQLYALLPQAPSQVKAQQDTQTKAEQEKTAEEKEQSERTLGVVPRFGTTDRMDAPPLTSGQKFRLFAKTSFDPVTVGIAAAQAGISQADGQFKGYGPGAEGYGKRFGAAYADQVSSGFFRTFLYPTIFKQDPRYFRLGHGGFVHRFGYSLVQGVVCHTDSGGRAFNISNVLGAFTSGGLSNVYYPSDDRGFKLTMSRSGLAVAYAAGGNLLSEFWPDIRRKVFKSK
jgi:hypothetical protein